MENTRIVLSGLWIAVMLTYLLGDVLRIFAGDFDASKMAGGVTANSRNVVVNRSNHVDSNRYGRADPDVKVSRDSLGKHHRSHTPVRF